MEVVVQGQDPTEEVAMEVEIHCLIKEVLCMAMLHEVLVNLLR